MEREVVAHAFEHELVERPQQAPPRALAIARPHHQLGEQRVVVDRDLEAAVDTGVVAHARSLREPHALDAADRGHESGGRILGQDAGLDRPAARRRRRVAEGERRALGDPDLLCDQVEAGHHLGHGMLDLEPGVHLEEVELAVLEDELHGAGVEVADLLCDPARGLREARAQPGVESGRRRLLQQLLVTALDRALALAEESHAPVRVGHDLRLDVPGALDRALGVDPRVAEGGLRLAARERPCRLQLGLARHPAHALAAAPGRGLEHERIADPARSCTQLFEGRERRLRARHHGHARLARRRPRRELVAERGDDVGARADEDDSGLLACAGERNALGEEAVAGMDGVGLLRARGRDHALEVEVALGRRSRSDRVGLVGEQHVERCAVGLAEHRDGRDRELAQRADHAHRDLAAVRDQHPANAGHLRPRLGCAAVCDGCAPPAHALRAPPTISPRSQRMRWRARRRGRA